MNDTAHKNTTTELKNSKNQTGTRGWPPARRAAQALRAKSQRLWLYSTGPKTPDGKAVSSMNGHKHGLRSKLYRDILYVFAEQRRFVRHCLKASRESLPALPEKRLPILHCPLSCYFNPEGSLSHPAL